MPPARRNAHIRRAKGGLITAFQARDSPCKLGLRDPEHADMKREHTAGVELALALLLRRAEGRGGDVEHVEAVKRQQEPQRIARIASLTH